MIAHRGLWTQADQQNTADAVWSAAQHGMWSEVDMRSCDSGLFIGHDKASVSVSTILDKFLFSDGQEKLRLAINVKEPSLHEGIKMIRGSLDDFFVFDIELVDPHELHYYVKILGYEHVAVRISPHERPQLLTGHVWYDRHHGGEIPFEEALSEIQSLIQRGISVHYVSPELHGKEIKNEDIVIGMSSTHVCTDFPGFYRHQVECYNKNKD